MVVCLSRSVHHPRTTLCLDAIDLVDAAIHPTDNSNPFAATVLLVYGSETATLNV